MIAVVLSALVVVAVAASLVWAAKYHAERARLDQQQEEWS